MIMLMTPKLARTYKRAKKDKEFCDAMNSTKYNSVPGMFVSEAMKIAFAAMYSGWLLSTLSLADYDELCDTI